MRFQLLLASFLISFSNGVPPKSHPYSPQENEFIVKELESRETTFDRHTWRQIAKAHEDKVKESAPGFSIHRTPTHLRQHFVDTIQRKRLPDRVRQLYKRVKVRAYSSEEERFINRELLSSTTELHASRTWAEIAKKHDEAAQSGVPGFTSKRSATALHEHFRKSMVKNGRVDEEVKQKYSTNFKTESGSTSFKRVNRRSRDQSANPHLYSPQEDELIVKELEYQASKYGNIRWKEIAKAHESQVQARAPGFSLSRSTDLLRQHFVDTLRHKMPSETVRQLYEKVKQSAYSPEEEQFINMGLQLCTSDLHSTKTWIGIANLHDVYRESDFPGFMRRRSAYALYSYFRKVMVPNNRVADAVKKKFPRCFKTEKGGISIVVENQSDIGPSNLVESDNNEDGEIWNFILEDLEVLQKSPVKSTNPTLRVS